MSSQETGACANVPDGHIACVSLTAFNFCAYGSFIPYPAQTCQKGLICCAASQSCNYAAACASLSGETIETTKQPLWIPSLTSDIPQTSPSVTANSNTQYNTVAISYIPPHPSIQYTSNSIPTIQSNAIATSPMQTLYAPSPPIPTRTTTSGIAPPISTINPIQSNTIAITPAGTAYIPPRIPESNPVGTAYPVPPLPSKTTIATTTTTTTTTTTKYVALGTPSIPPAQVTILIAAPVGTPTSNYQPTIVYSTVTQPFRQTPTPTPTILHSSPPYVVTTNTPAYVIPVIITASQPPLITSALSFTSPTNTTSTATDNSTIITITSSVSAVVLAAIATFGMIMYRRKKKETFYPPTDFIKPFPIYKPDTSTYNMPAPIEGTLPAPQPQPQVQIQPQPQPQKTQPQLQPHPQLQQVPQDLPSPSSQPKVILKKVNAPIRPQPVPLAQLDSDTPNFYRDSRGSLHALDDDTSPSTSAIAIPAREESLNPDAIVKRNSQSSEHSSIFQSFKNLLLKTGLGPSTPTGGGGKASPSSGAHIHKGSAGDAESLASSMKLWSIIVAYDPALEANQNRSLARPSEGRSFRYELDSPVAHRESQGSQSFGSFSGSMRRMYDNYRLRGLDGTGDHGDAGAPADEVNDVLDTDTRATGTFLDMDTVDEFDTSIAATDLPSQERLAVEPGQLASMTPSKRVSASTELFPPGSDSMHVSWLLPGNGPKTSVPTNRTSANETSLAETAEKDGIQSLPEKIVSMKQDEDIILRPGWMDADVADSALTPTSSPSTQNFPMQKHDSLPRILGAKVIATLPDQIGNLKPISPNAPKPTPINTATLPIEPKAMQQQQQNQQQQQQYTRMSTGTPIIDYKSVLKPVTPMVQTAPTSTARQSVTTTTTTTAPYQQRPSKAKNVMKFDSQQPQESAVMHPTHVSKDAFFGSRGDELTIGAGDLIHVIQEFKDGWCQAVNLSQGKKKGMVPKYYLKSVKGGIGPSRRVVRVVEGEKEEDTVGKGSGNIVWVGALSPGNKRHSNDSLRSVESVTRVNARDDSLQQ